NGSLKPEHIQRFSNKKVWWKCEFGHEWAAAAAHRMSGENCPVCAGQKVLAGFNDLATTNPSLAEEWDYTHNEGALPSQFTANSHKKVWWKCKSGHSWRATIKSRSEGNNCPYCSNQKVLAGYNDLETQNDGLLAEWDFEKNSEICLPNEVTSGSKIKVWWKCKKCNYSWKTAIVKRKNGTGCPRCFRERQKVRFSKQVVCVETGQEFSSLDEAASWAGVTKGAISMAALGKTKSSAGYHWKYST
ncbi:MAG: zinc-ribbon domain-containing protein, partial [Oscillibacter sp.]|nr:zinc-ribbon domain-containing protein [Oscillibacter sp.]